MPHEQLDPIVSIHLDTVTGGKGLGGGAGGEVHRKNWHDRLRDRIIDWTRGREISGPSPGEP